MPDPLHGLTLEQLLTALVDQHGWAELARRVPLRCFERDPSIASSLRFLRKTPWARSKVEAAYVNDVRAAERKRKRNKRRAARRAFAASLPTERDDTLAFFWPQGAPPPEVTCPSGVEVRLGADRAAFEQVQAAIGFVVTDAHWAGIVLVDDGMVVAEADGQPVAVACAESRDEGWSELAWVAVAPACRGRGLGRLVCSALIAHLLAHGHDRIVGSTQDHRLHALRIYLGLGFRPLERPEKAERWAAVHAALAGTGAGTT